MKEISIQQLPATLRALVEACPQERVLITRKDKPIAVLVGIENKDEEDIALERDADFWKMIHERRRQKTIPFEQVKKRLGLVNGNAKPPPRSRYSILIQWSDEKQVYLVFLPEFSKEPQTRGATYQEAVKNAQKTLEERMDYLEESGRDLPTPRTHEAKVTGRRKIKKRISHGKTA